MLYDNYDIETRYINNELYYKAKDITNYLDLSNPRQVCANLEQEDKKLVSMFYTSGTKYVLFINFSGCMSIICSSNKPNAKHLKKWFIKNINNPFDYTNQIKILNENDLHCSIVKFLRNEYNDIALFTASLGENQINDNLRIESYKKGYTKGAADLIILNPNQYYNSFVIEFKNPNNNYNVSENQKSFLQKSLLNNQKVLLSNNYSHIIKEIIYYFLSVRLKCLYCKRKFKTSSTLESHIKYIHRNKKDVKSLFN